MFPGLVSIEIKKCKRTFIPWMILIGGVLTAFIAFMMTSYGNYEKSWANLAAMGLNFVNLLALLLVAVFSGYVFVTEYHESTISILFTYPVSRLKLYVAKYSVILFWVIILYLIFFVSIMGIGFLSMRQLPQTDFLIKFIKLMPLIIISNFVLVPVTVLMSIVIKGIGTYILAGMGYFVAYMSFISSDSGVYMPPCIPDKLAKNYMVMEYMGKADFRAMIIVSAVTFLSAFLIGAVCYCRNE